MSEIVVERITRRGRTVEIFRETRSGRFVTRRRRLVEFTAYYDYTEGGIKVRNFECRLRVPMVGEPTRKDIALAYEQMGNIMLELGIDIYGFKETRMGWETIGTTKAIHPQWKVIDKARPQYQYPKKGWGRVGAD